MPIRPILTLFIFLQTLPGYADVASKWTFPTSVYSPETPAEAAYCPSVPTCQTFTDCCANSVCAARLVNNAVRNVCLRGEMAGNATVTDDGTTVTISAGDSASERKRKRRILATTEGRTRFKFKGEGETDG